jgi:hypothetical protein
MFIKYIILFLSLISLCGTFAGAETIVFSDSFDTSALNQPPNGWTSQPYCKVTSSESWSGPRSVNTRDQGYFQNSCSTYGFGHVFFGFFYKVSGLESGETCEAEYSVDNGSTWITARSIGSTSNGAAWQNGGINLPFSDTNKTNFMFRFRSNSNSNTDICYWDEVNISCF